MTLFYLPGFLGKGEEGKAVSPLDSLQANSLIEYGKLFNQFAESYPAPRLLIGYSMGGRQALHAMILKPHLYQKVILVSTHPGLQSEQEREARLKQDAIWAKRFLTESWESLMDSWNGQQVFKGSAIWPRDENDYDRKILAHQLLSYSLGSQRNLRLEMEQHADKILFVTGELDPKFTALSKELPYQISKIILGQTGHRITFPLILEEVIAKIPPRY